VRHVWPGVWTREGGLPTFFEFFAGGGMVRAGLGARWRCLFANDFDAKKAACYARNWGGKELKVCDVRHLKLEDLPKGAPDLVWASFPCQDLSLAGAGAGLEGERSGSFWPFWRLVRGLVQDSSAPSMIVLENVVGALTSHEGRDFRAIMSAFAEIGFDAGAMIIDARHFLPQSRPRLFFIGAARGSTPRLLSTLDDEHDLWRPRALERAYFSLPESLQRRWIWWRMPPPAKREVRFADLIEDPPVGVRWHPKAETRRLISMMAPLHRARLEEIKARGRLMVGAMYRRTRRENGETVQRVEVRFDDVAGCLRTPAGGSSRQLLLIVDGEEVRSRLISARETARLMGLRDDYELPERYNDAYHLTGDGVVVDVVRHLSKHVLLPHLHRTGAAEEARSGKLRSSGDRKTQETQMHTLSRLRERAG
jgi:DNA (cytosine-5)-methyltransferase 1